MTTPVSRTSRTSTSTRAAAARRAGRPGRLGAAAAALAVAAAAAGTLACDVQRAVDCARLALSVADAAADLERAASTEGLSDDSSALDELAEEIRELEDRVGDTDIQQAAEAVLEAGRNIQRAAEQGEAPDLSPLADATDELTSVCTPDGE
ncbi:hypothetical protein [Streptomyces sp. 7-21]|uniref:hypothetical protein n=1 Tax=Streptomyces sp. 7-21 TaxID=2802283 RepID=UPI00191E0831|nr:hypothetical protein [Streptomyces sp. 7-21]MBL1068463.1 hypothetical protein [Streptomyces sp. 7-21]